MFLSSKVSGKVNWLFPPFMRMKQYLRHYTNGKAADSVVTNTHTSATILLPKWSTLEPFTKDMGLLKSFEPSTSLFVDPAGAAFPPTNFGFQLWYDCPTALYKSNCHLLGANWNQPDRPSVAINISTAAPNLKMLFHGVLAGLPAVVLADSGASHTLIDQAFVLQDQLTIRPCPFSSASLASGQTVNLLGQTTVKLGLGPASVTVTALVMTSLVPGLHLILGDEWLTHRKVHLDYDTLSLWFMRHGHKVVLPSLSQAPRTPRPVSARRPHLAYS